jgi:hypothetical protein
MVSSKLSLNYTELESSPGSGNLDIFTPGHVGTRSKVLSNVKEFSLAL